MKVRDEINGELESSCRLDENFHLYCYKTHTAPTKSDVLELFETLRAQMPVAEDLIKEKYESMSFLRKAGKGLEKTQVEV